MLSVFTPTHNPEHLDAAYRSLRDQPVNFEWVIVPNGPCTVDAIPPHIRADSRVRIVPWLVDGDDGSRHIGALKQFACLACRGDVFVELDHDDQLTPDALQQVEQQVADGAGFVYSDAAGYTEDADGEDNPVLYDERHGWETYQLQLHGQTYTAHRNFEITARSLCEIYYAPDHVRCWTRDTYFSVGGHNSELDVGDDHDLMCRTYLGGVEFGYTGTCGYLYRHHAFNTTKERQTAIVRQQQKNCNIYLHRLITEWCRRKSYPALTVDLRLPNVGFTFDSAGRLEIQAADNSIGAVQAFDVLQYVSPPMIIPTLNEIYRVLVPGGWACLAAPSTDGRGAFMPYYKSWWNEYTMLFLCETEHRRHFQERMPNGPLRARFQPVRLWTAFPTEALLPHPFKTHKNANVSYVYADLCAIKGQRQPGLVEM